MFPEPPWLGQEAAKMLRLVAWGMGQDRSHIFDTRRNIQTLRSRIAFARLCSGCDDDDASRLNFSRYACAPTQAGVTGRLSTEHDARRVSGFGVFDDMIRKRGDVKHQSASGGRQLPGDVRSDPLRDETRPLTLIAEAPDPDFTAFSPCDDAIDVGVPGALCAPQVSGYGLPSSGHPISSQTIPRV